MKKTLLATSVSVVLAAFSLSAHAASMTMSTGGDGGGYDGTICEEGLIAPAQEAGVDLNCVPSRGSIENMQRTNSGETDSGITQTDLLYKAWEDGETWADNLNPGGRAFTTESLLCFSAGQLGGMKQLRDARLDGKKWKIVTPEIGSGSNGSVDFYMSKIPGLAENVEVIPTDTTWDVNKVISRLKTRNPKKRADAACFVGLPDPLSNNNIKSVSANDNLSWVPMDDNTALQIMFGEDQIYPAILPVPIKGSWLDLARGKAETVEALQIPVTYVYNDNIDPKALEMLSKQIDQNPEFLQKSGVIGKILGKMQEAGATAMSVAKQHL